MKLLIDGDVHGNCSHMITLLHAAKGAGCDRMFQLGDFGAWEHMPMGVKFFDDVDRHAKLNGVTVYWLDGNHDKISYTLEKYKERDDEGFLICRDNVRYAPRGHRWTWADTRFIALGGAYSVDKGWRVEEEWRLTMKSERAAAAFGGTPRDFSGTYWFPEEEMTDEQFMAIIDADPEPVDVIFSHDKPKGSNPPWNRKDFLECVPNQNRIQHALSTLEAKRLYHGHLHFPYTDRIPTGDDRYAWVFGLDCDPEAQQWAGYTKEGSWTVVDLPFADD